MAIDPALILRAVGTGLLFGASAGLAPGPLLALVVAESVRGGTGCGIRVAAAPLLTDTPIVIGSVLLVGALRRPAERDGGSPIGARADAGQTGKHLADLRPEFAGERITLKDHRSRDGIAVSRK